MDHANVTPRVELRSKHLRVILLPSHGGEVHSIEDRRTGIDVLYKTAWAPHGADARLWAPDSTVEWLDNFFGGWQLLTPSAGDECDYAGVHHPYHGEACASPWCAGPVQQLPSGSRLTMSTRLRRSPLRLRRIVHVSDAEPVLEVTDVIANEGSTPLPVMWTQHMIFGGPLVSEGCVITCGATRITADPHFDGPHNPLGPGASAPWPPRRDREGPSADLAVLPAPGSPRHLLAYLSGFGDQAWFGLGNPGLDLQVRATWSASQMPHAWLWQELNASPGYPWYGTERAVGIEPASSVPARGIAGAVAADTHRMIGPGASAISAVKVVLEPTTDG